MVLGFSRMRYAEFTSQIDIFNLLQCHVNAFNYFRDYPQEILYDNIKQIVLDLNQRSLLILICPIQEINTQYYINSQKDGQTSDSRYDILVFVGNELISRHEILPGRGKYRMIGIISNLISNISRLLIKQL